MYVCVNLKLLVSPVVVVLVTTVVLVSSLYNNFN